jgi:hypothetical protein
MNVLRRISTLFLFAFACSGYTLDLFGQAKGSKSSNANTAVKKEIKKVDNTLDQTNETFDDAGNTADKAKATFDKVKNTFKPKDQGVSENEKGVDKASEAASAGLIIKIKGFEYEDEQVTSLISELEKVSGVGEISYKFKSDLSTLEVASDQREKLWGKIPVEVKKYFTVVEIGDGVIDLRKRKK